jgi:hypothetical protein
VRLCVGEFFLACACVTLLLFHRPVLRRRRRPRDRRCGGAWLGVLPRGARRLTGHGFCVFVCTQIEAAKRMRDEMRAMADQIRAKVRTHRAWEIHIKKSQSQCNQAKTLTSNSNQAKTITSNPNQATLHMEITSNRCAQDERVQVLAEEFEKMPKDINRAQARRGIHPGCCFLLLFAATTTAATASAAAAVALLLLLLLLLLLRLLLLQLLLCASR